MDLAFQRDFRRRCIVLSRSRVAMYFSKVSRGNILQIVALVSLMSRTIMVVGSAVGEYRFSREFSRH